LTERRPGTSWCNRGTIGTYFVDLPGLVILLSPSLKSCTKRLLTLLTHTRLSVLWCLAVALPLLSSTLVNTNPLNVSLAPSAGAGSGTIRQPGSSVSTSPVNNSWPNNGHKRSPQREKIGKSLVHSISNLRLAFLPSGEAVTSAARAYHCCSACHTAAVGPHSRVVPKQAGVFACRQPNPRRECLLLPGRLLLSSTLPCPAQLHHHQVPSRKGGPAAVLVKTCRGSNHRPARRNKC